MCSKWFSMDYDVFLSHAQSSRVSGKLLVSTQCSSLALVTRPGGCGLHVPCCT